MLYLPSFSQVENRILEVFCITEYIDGYIIKAIDKLKSDTLNIISLKDNSKHSSHYEKIIVGKKYTFKFEGIANRMPAMPPNELIVRIKITVVWKDGDGVNNMPVFARNMRGLYIKK